MHWIGNILKKARPHLEEAVCYELLLDRWTNQMRMTSFPLPACMINQQKWVRKRKIESVEVIDLQPWLLIKVLQTWLHIQGIQESTS